MTGAAVAVAGLTKEYDGRPILQGISFEVGTGVTFALLGPNGAGKTTTVEILEGFRRADGGQVEVLGRDPAHAARDHRARVGIMLQGGGGVDPRITAHEAVDLHGRFHRDSRDTGELLENVGLERAAGTRFRRLSGGERQRLGLALALVGRPELVILDEPTAGLDVEARGVVRRLLAELRGEGVTILLTSHDLTDVERVADRIAIIDRGRIVALGATAELSSASSPVLRFRLGRALSNEDRGQLAARLLEVEAGSALVDEGGGWYRLEGVPPDPAIVAAVATWCAACGALIAELRAGSPTLEERYLELVGTTVETDDEESSP